MYCAYVTTISNLQKHPNADRLQIGVAHGCNVIVDMETHAGTLGVLFPDGGQLSGHFALANKLYRKHPMTGEPMGGYMEENARVKALKLRGCRSEGLWLPLQALQLAGEDSRWGSLKEGDELTEWAGKPLCEKYYTPATRKAMQQPGQAGKKAKEKALLDVAFPRHYDTPQLRHMTAQLPSGLRYVTSKLHGTSGRTGYVSVPKPMSWLKKAWNWITPSRFNLGHRFTPLQYITGTRNCVLNMKSTGEKSKNFRQEIHEVFEDNNLLRPNETWYYEIVGYEGVGGGPIMARHTVGGLGDKAQEKELERLYGKTFEYSYGCDPRGPLVASKPAYRVFVYRITQDGKDLTFDHIRQRVIAANRNLHEPAFEVVPLLSVLTEDEDVLSVCEALAEMPEPLAEGKHPREGVCVRVEQHCEATDETLVGKALKLKSFVFRALEGHACDKSDYVDKEDVS